MSRRRAVEIALALLIPGAPDYDMAEVVDHALASPGLRKAAPETAAWLSLVAYIRHTYTDYDSLLEDGYGLEAARHFCRAEINEVLGAWGSRRLVADDEDTA
jgi:hypothetical protein